MRTEVPARSMNDPPTPQSSPPGDEQEGPPSQSVPTKVTGEFEENGLDEQEGDGNDQGGKSL
jgi:hypothetical protein